MAVSGFALARRRVLPTPFRFQVAVSGFALTQRRVLLTHFRLQVAVSGFSLAHRRFLPACVVVLSSSKGEIEGILGIASAFTYQLLCLFSRDRKSVHRLL